MVNTGGVACLFKECFRYQIKTGESPWELTPKELWLRLEALEDERSRGREDIYRALRSAGDEIMSADDQAKKLFL